MSELAGQIRGALESGFIPHRYPVLINPGVRDEDVLVHSLGCSLWTMLGHDLGFAAVVEAPAPPGGGGDIRSDSIWFNREDWTPVALVEFERFQSGPRGHAKLEVKVQNLLEAAMRWGTSPQLLVLSAWSTGVVNAPPLDTFRRLLRYGFRNAHGIPVSGGAGLRLLFHRLILKAHSQGVLTLERSSCEEVP